MLAGGKFRSRVRMYCDTPNEPTGEAMGKQLQERIARGFTMLKMDLGVQPIIGVKGALSWPQGMLPGDLGDKVEQLFNTTQIMHPFTHVRLTPKGITLICEYVEQVRSVVGDEVPIAADHFGHIGIDDCIRRGTDSEHGQTTYDSVEKFIAADRRHHSAGRWAQDLADLIGQGC
jgi:L-alanine-DL-glutamate epimerase-like enolase superfamily enzyme